MAEAVMASYLKAEEVTSEGRTVIAHAGDFVGASPASSALLQDEPSIQFLNLRGNKHCKRTNDMHKKCNVIGTLGNHEFDEGVDELMRLLDGGNQLVTNRSTAPVHKLISSTKDAFAYFGADAFKPARRLPAT